MDQAILVQPNQQPDRGSKPGSAIGTILLHIQNDRSNEQRLQFALSLARATGAHLECAQITPIEAYVTTGTLGGVLALGKAMEKVDADDNAMESRIRSRLALEDVSWDYEHVTGYETVELVHRAALADLLIVGRDPHASRAQRPQLSVLGDILDNCRTQLLIPATGGGGFDPFGPALIAWNGSYEAANATRAAIGLLKLASRVKVVRFTEDRPNAFSDIRLTQYLSRHGVHAELDVREVREDYVTDLVEYASGYGASYIVMGGYGHSRAGEFLFGGVTRELLRDCPLTLIMSH
jgi:hypothetical protein